MLLSLMFVQAHSVVPHHHHAEGKAVLAHDHDTHSHTPVGVHWDHHDQSGHDEAFLSLDAKHRVHHIDFALPILPEPVVVSYGTYEAVLKIAALPDHPPVHGPPRPFDSRGPPAPPAA